MQMCLCVCACMHVCVCVCNQQVQCAAYVFHVTALATTAANDVCSFIAILCLFSSALKVLLEHGADVNLQDEFSSVYRVARQKRYDSYAGV